MALALAGTTLLGAMWFEEVDVPGVAVSGPDALSGKPVTNYRHADMDGNGAQDIVTPTRVFFQRNGAFDADMKAEVPGGAEQAPCDIWPGADEAACLYLRLEKGLRVVQWTGEAWLTVLEQEMAWPRAARTSPAAMFGRDRGVQFERFLHDIDGDGTPEIIVPNEDGVHVYRRSGDGFAHQECLDILPPLRLAAPESEKVWPEEARQIILPAREMSCRLVIEGNTASILTRRDIPPRECRYTVQQYELGEGADALKAKPVIETEALPSHFQPCRLNGDDVIDFAGGDWEWSRASALPMPIFETSATTDRGKTFAKARTVSFRPLCSFADFNGDGRLDMITESTGLFDGGIRETMMRVLSSSQVEHEVAVHLQDAEGGFPAKPSLSGRFRVETDVPLARDGDLFLRYQACELADISGDFTGDGVLDAVIQDQRDRLAIYAGGMTGFSPKPVGALQLRAGGRFGLADVNQDGRCDIVVRWYEEESEGLAEETRVYLTREDES